MRNFAYIVDAARTAIGNFCGQLSTVRVDDLAALVIKELVARNPWLEGEEIEDVLMGCANQAGEDNRNVARMAALLAGLPCTVPGETINRLCASGMAAVVNASRAIQLGDGNIYLAGGVEGMTRGPWVISKSSQPFGRDVEMHDSSFGWRFVNAKMEELYGTDGMGQTAENLAEKYAISREDQDKFAYWSQMKAVAAQQRGRFACEIVPITIQQKKQNPLSVDKDEFIKANTTLDILSKLKPAFKKEGGSVTAGNASGLNDGAALLLLTSEQVIQQKQLNPMARIVSSAVVGIEPKFMGIGPVEAANKALKRAKLSMDHMDIIELNEAFAAQSLACIRAWGLQDNDTRINPNGGAIALGHPLGMSGARIIQTAALELQQTNKRYALVSLCVGVGQGYAIVLERV